MSVLLGLGAAACFGSGDFLGGTASRRSSTAAVLVLSQAFALALAVVYAFAFAGDATARDVLFGAVAGVLNVIGVGCLYQGLATGRMGVVAPVTAMAASVVPIAWGLGAGERPSTAAFVGIGLLVVAGGLIGWERDTDAGGSTSRALAWSMGAAGAFGTSLIFFAETGADSGFWPVLTARAAAVPVVVGVVLLTRSPWLPARPDRVRSVGAGALDVTATALLLVALRRDLLTIVAPIAALAPALTVILAWFFLQEAVRRAQRVGIVVALCGLALVAPG